MKKWMLLSSICIFSVILSSCAALQKLNDPVKRISIEDARAKAQAGEALLVCSYDDGRCGPILLEGAILKSELEAKIPSLSKDQEIIFYCS